MSEEHNTLILEREYKDDVTLGRLIFPDNTTFETLELPWDFNKRDVSCIPDGEYLVSKRQSGVVARTSRNKYQEGWEICDVPKRSYIMIHIGNTVDDIQGCVCIGLTKGTLNDKPAVLNSRKAFDKFMEKMEEQPYWRIQILGKKIDA